MDSHSLQLFDRQYLFSDPAIIKTLTNFINEGFKYANERDTERWDMSDDRLNDGDDLLDTIGDKGVLAVLYDKDEPIASAAVASWKGDMESGSVGRNETGWEVKLVTVKIGYMKQGLAGRCINALEEHLLTQQKETLGDGPLRLWIQTVDDVNGDYWRRRGWKNVRSFEKPVGYWGSYHGFHLMILLKELSNNPYH